MRIVAKHKPEGGWECMVEYAPGERCRQNDLRGWKDAETHVQFEHGVKETYMDPDTLDIRDATNLAKEVGL